MNKNSIPLNSSLSIKSKTKTGKKNTYINQEKTTYTGN